MNIENYFKELEDKVHVAYSVAEEARRKGLDPKSSVEVPLATSLAGRVAGLVSTIYPQLNNPQLINRIIELENEYGSLDPAICLKIAEEIAKERFCKFESLLDGIDAGLRVAFGYLTLGVVAAPLEGYTHFKLKKTAQGKDYFSVYFSGPIGGAGRTAARQQDPHGDRLFLAPCAGAGLHDDLPRDAACVCGTRPSAVPQGWGRDARAGAGARMGVAQLSAARSGVHLLGEGRWAGRHHARRNAG